MKRRQALEDLLVLTRMTGEPIDPITYDEHMPQTLAEAKGYIAIACAVLNTLTGGQELELAVVMAQGQDHLDEAAEAVERLDAELAAPFETGTHPEAHALLGEFAASQPVRKFLSRFASMQGASECGGWWRTDLGGAIEEVWGHLKIAVERASRAVTPSD